jgi:hypothetical protein
MMARTEREQQSPKPFSDLVAAVGVFVALFGIGLATLLGTLAVKDLLGAPLFAVFLCLGIALTLGGGAGGIYWLVASRGQNDERKLPLGALIRGALEGGVRPGEHWKRTGQILWKLIWFLPLVVTPFILDLWLLAKDSKGSEISGTLAFLMSIVTLGIIVLLFLISMKPYITVAPPKPVALLVAVALGVVCGYLYWTVIHKKDLPVTDLLSASMSVGAQKMQNGSQEIIEIPGMPPQRRHLFLISTLTNAAKVGDCVAPAWLHISLMIDGKQAQSVSVRSGHEARLDLAGVTHQANAIVTVQMQDPSCTVALGVDEAVLYN